MSNLTNMLETPQVIIGVDDNLQFDAFERMRSSNVNSEKVIGAGSVADWYTNAVAQDSIFLSTMENSDILSFTHKFNSDSSSDQGLFVIEVLDPTNTFEARFFRFFYYGMESYMDQLYPKQGLSRAEVRKLKTNIGKMPFQRAMYITFGSGNDARYWAPVQKASLAAMDYDLTKDGVRKITLKFVPNPGMLRMGEQKDIEEYLTPGIDSLTIAKEAFITLTEDGKSLVVGDPYETVERLIQQLFKNSSKGQAYLILADIEADLTHAWKEAVLNATHQYLSPIANADFSDLYDEGENPNPVDWEYVSRQLAKQILESQTADYVFGDHTNSVKDKDGNVVKQTSWVPVNANVSIPKGAVRGETAKERDLLFKRHLVDYKYRAHWIEGKVGPHLEGLAKGLWNISEGGRNIVAAIEARVLNNDPEAGSQFLDAAGQSYLDAWKGGTQGFRTDWQPPILLHDVVHKTAGLSELVKALIEKGPERFHYLEGEALREEIYGGKKLPSILTGIKLSDLEVYTIFHNAATHYFEKLGFAVTSNEQNTLAIRPTIPLAGRETDVGDPGTDINELVQDSIKPLNVVAVVKEPSQVREFLNNVLGHLGSLTKYDPYTTCFSELGLVKRIHEHIGIAVEQNKLDATWKFEAMDTVFLVASYDVVASFINAEKLKDTHPVMKATGKMLTSKNLYEALFAAFRDFKLGEPSMDLLGQVNPWGTLFQNPDIESTLLSKHTRTLDDGTTDVINNHISIIQGGNPEGYEDNDALNLYLAKNRIPVFKYGLNNSNIIDFHFDLKPWYGLLLGAIPTIATNGFVSRTVKNLDITEKLLGFLDSKEERSNEQLENAIGAFWDDNYGIAPAGSRLARSPDAIREAEETSAQLRSGDYLDRQIIHEIGVTEGLIAEVPGEDTRGIKNPKIRVPTRQGFIDTYLFFITQVLISPDTSEFFVTNPNKTPEDLAEIGLLIRNKLANRTFRGRIKTLPLYSLMSVAKGLGNRALLYFVEPEIVTSHDFKLKGVRSTWLTGEYYIVGYEVKIMGTHVSTSFNVVKNAVTTLSNRVGFM